jgi:hypothetical protein
LEALQRASPATDSPGGAAQEEPPGATPQQQPAAREADEEEDDDAAASPGVRAALAALRWYQTALSPLMASACRFQPTCSQYAKDSYRK